MQAENSETSPTNGQQTAAEAWREVTHRLAGAVGIMRAAEGEFEHLSDEARELVNEGVTRLRALIGDCAHNQILAEREARLLRS